MMHFHPKMQFRGGRQANVFRRIGGSPRRPVPCRVSLIRDPVIKDFLVWYVGSIGDAICCSHSIQGLIDKKPGSEIFAILDGAYLDISRAIGPDIKFISNSRDRVWSGIVDFRRIRRFGG